jgi:hypothetical protein
LPRRYSEARRRIKVVFPDIDGALQLRDAPAPELIAACADR